MEGLCDNSYKISKRHILIESCAQTGQRRQFGLATDPSMEDQLDILRAKYPQSPNSCFIKPGD